MIYLDNSATTKPHQDVIHIMNRVMKEAYGNPASLHGLGVKAERWVEEARQVIARAIRAHTPQEIVFTSGGTEANNLAIQGVALQYQHRGKHLITTQIEHPAVYDVFRYLEHLGFQVTYLPVDDQGCVHVEQVKAAITDETIFVSVMHVNNEVGSLQPIAEIGELLSQYPKILFHVDAVQSFGRYPVDVKKWKIDLLSLSGHKLHGPKGIGCLYVRKGIELKPLFYGGGQERNLRSGTLNVPAIAGLAKAVVLAERNREQRMANYESWKQMFIQRILETLPNAKVHAPQGAPYILSLSFPGLKSEVLVHALEEKNIYVSSKSACSSKKTEPSRVLLAMGKSEAEALSSIRISFGYDTKEEDVIACCEALQEIVPRLEKLMRVETT